MFKRDTSDKVGLIILVRLCYVPFPSLPTWLAVAWGLEGATNEPSKKKKLTKRQLGARWCQGSVVVERESGWKWMKGDESGRKWMFYSALTTGNQIFIVNHAAIPTYPNCWIERTCCCNIHGNPSLTGELKVQHGMEPAPNVNNFKEIHMYNYI